MNEQSPAPGPESGVPGFPGLNGAAGSVPGLPPQPPSGFPPFLAHPNLRPSEAVWSVNRWTVQSPAGPVQAVLLTAFFGNGSVTFVSPKEQALSLSAAIAGEAEQCTGLVIPPPGLSLPKIDPRMFRPGNN